VKKIEKVKESAEEKIKKAARELFMRKGYAATRTRDIADEAGINLALLNYYFRSKEKLFHEVMLEKMQQFFGLLLPIISNAETKLQTKIELIVDNYIDLLTENPDLPLFVLSEMKLHPQKIKEILPVQKLTPDISFIKQLKEKKPGINPLHFLMNILGMTIFPFVARPAFDALASWNKIELDAILQERKKMIPVWVKVML
jgi:AcrR family transcriptional regulator